MKNLFNQSDRENLIARLYNLHPDCQRRWGKMSVAEILPHLSDPFRATLGEKKVEDVSNAITRGFIGKMMVRHIPWPKSAFTSPSFLPGTGMTAFEGFEDDKQALILLIHRFANVDVNTAFQPHPVFGNLSKRDYGRLYWRHLDHHLRQFGV